MKRAVALGSIILSVGVYGVGPARAQTPSATPQGEPAAGSQRTPTNREQAYAKLFEGQRHMWRLQRMRTQAGRGDSRRLAKEAFEEAVTLDPTLAEAYTALAQLAVAVQPRDIDEGIRRAQLAVRANPQNLGGHRMLGRLFTVKSRLGNGPLDLAIAERAQAEWKEVARIDPRNAEAWAFLAAFAEAQGRTAEQIDALRKWISAGPPPDVTFYEGVMGGTSLSPDSASVKLAAALAKSGKDTEAATILSELISDDPEHAEAIGLLGELVGSIDGAAAASTVAALRQAVYANPDNVSLIDMLARLQGRTGQFDEAAALLKRHVAGLYKTDARAASTLAVSLAELYVQKDRYDDAAAALENSLAIRGIGANSVAKNEDREFVQYIFERLIQVGKLANRPQAVRAYIDRAKKILGGEDSFADRHLISFLEGQGNRQEAVDLVRTLRATKPADIWLLRTEASLLTDLGKVDSAVELVRKHARSASPGPAVGGSGGTGTISIPVPATDEFSDLLFISNLYTRAKRDKDAIDTANRAIAIAAGTERRQIARMTLATGLQMSGNTAEAEKTLREILKETPGNPIALNNLGYFLTERGEKLDEAVELIKSALRIDPSNSSYLDSLGWAYFKLGKVDEAEKYLREAVRADPDSAATHEHLGDVFQGKNESAKARSHWERALRLSTEQAEIERLKKKLGK